MTSNPLRFRRLDLPESTKQRGQWYCEKISSGCRNCYAEALSLTVGNKVEFNKKNRDKIEPWVDHKELASYKKLPPGTKVFLGSMTDVMAFREFTTMDHFLPIWLAMWSNPHVIFQILTKRPGCYWLWENEIAQTDPDSILLPDWFDGDVHARRPIWPDNIWLGTTVENRVKTTRIEALQDMRKYTRAPLFLSVEPLLEDLGEVDLTDIDWVICGGESGKNMRPFDKQWAQNLQQQCASQDVAFWFKQGSNMRPGADTLLNGREFKEWPR